jgi:hypothetical protein
MAAQSADHEPYDTGNQRHVQRKARDSKLRERRLAEAFKWLMGDARGRLLMWQRLADAGVFRSSMAASPELTAFKEGRRDIGLKDLALIMRLCPDHYTRMAAEATQGSPETTTDGDEDGGRNDSDQ